MNIPRIMAAALLALCLEGSPAHSQGMLGVGISDSQVDPKGAFVGTVQPGSPAAAAGIVPGDIITAVDGAPIAGAAQLKQVVAGHAAGAALRLQVAHYGAPPSEISVTLGGAPAAATPPPRPRPHRTRQRPLPRRRSRPGPTSPGPVTPILGSMPSPSTCPRDGASRAGRGG